MVVVVKSLASPPTNQNGRRMCYKERLYSTDDGEKTYLVATQQTFFASLGTIIKLDLPRVHFVVS